MQISNITKKISLTIFALFLAFSFSNTSFAQTPPTLTLTATPTTVKVDEFAIISWISKNTYSCYSGAGRPTTTSGSFRVGPLKSTTSYTVSCSGYPAPGTNAEKTVTVVVTSGKIVPPIITLTPGTTDNTGNTNSNNYTPTVTPPVALEPDPSLNKDTDTTYTWLEQLPGFDTTFDSTKKCAFVDYLNIIIKLLIGIGAVLAMVMIVMGGMEYMTSELISSKESGKDKIKNAMLGLVLALSAYLILNTLNPNLLNLCLDQQLPNANITISPDDTSTGSMTGPGLCIDTNAPDPNTATGTNITPNSIITSKYIPALNSVPGLSKGAKLLMISQTVHEGFAPGTKSFRTNNPGNIGNTDDGSIKSYTTILEGVKAQHGIVTRVANGTSKSYKIGSKPTCAIGNETYNGSLYQYLRIYSTGARDSNNYLNSIIGYFAQNGVTITPNTTIAQINNIN